MPLPELPDNNTARLFCDYTSMGIAHTVMVRLPDSVTPSQALDFANKLTDAMSYRTLESDSFTAARLAPQGSNFSFPLAYVAGPGRIASAGNIWGQDPESTFLTMVARSAASGRRARFTHFTPITSASWPLNNRYEPGESAPVDTYRINVQNVLNGSLTGGVAEIGRASCRERV